MTTHFRSQLEMSQTACGLTMLYAGATATDPYDESIDCGPCADAVKAWSAPSGKIVVDTSQRVVVQVIDVDGHPYRDVAVPFGIKDTLAFGELIVTRHRPEFEIIKTEDGDNPVIVVCERQAT